VTEVAAGREGFPLPRSAILLQPLEDAAAAEAPLEDGATDREHA
jgi:hypothetical protein